MSRLYVDKDTLVMAINASLVYWGGGTFGKIVFNMLIETNINYEEYQPPRFFQPYKAKEDWLNIYSPITAPITFLLLAAEMALAVVIYTLNTLFAAVTFNGKGLLEDGKTTGQALLNTLLFCFAAVISPIINLVDVIGSVISTAIDGCKVDTNTSEDNNNLLVN